MLLISETACRLLSCARGIVPWSRRIPCPTTQPRICSIAPKSRMLPALHKLNPCQVYRQGGECGDGLQDAMKWGGLHSEACAGQNKAAAVCRKRSSNKTAGGALEALVLDPAVEMLMLRGDDPGSMFLGGSGLCEIAC